MVYETLNFFNFNVDSYWQYDPCDIIKEMVVVNKKFASEIQHVSKPLLDMLKNKDSWDEVNKEMGETAVEKIISLE